MAIDESLEQTAISSDRVGSAPAVAPGALALAETHLSAQGSIVRDMTLRSDSPQVSAGPLPGQIGRYLVIRSIAAGGMGEVVEAFDPELDRRVALKLLKTGRGGDDSQARLLREAQAMARLSHANVVQIHDVGVQDDRVFLAMELVVGETLTRWLATPRSWREVVRVFVAAARGLAAAHRAGLVHRDFKPDNVLMGADGQPRVADFGLAREDQPALAEAARNPGEVGLLADRLTATEDYRWEPEKSPKGPLSILMSSADRRLIVFRNGVEVGRAKFAAQAPELKLGSHVYMVQEIADGKPRWIAVGVPGHKDEDQRPLDEKAIAGLDIPDEFQAKLVPLLAPGTAVMVTDEPILAQTSGVPMTVLANGVAAGAGL